MTERSPDRRRQPSAETTVHSLHGIVTIALVNAEPGAIAEVEDLLGPSAPTSAGDADVRIVFVDQLPRSADTRYLGLREAAFDTEHFYLLDEFDRRLRVDLAGGLDNGCEIHCEHGLSIASILLPLLGLLLMRKGHVLLHASAVRYEGKGILVTGWTKGGKTEVMLACMAAGAEYVSDEWTIVSPEGTLRGIGAAPTLWGWHFRYLPQYWSRLPRGDRQRLRAVRLYQQLYRLLPQREVRSTPLRLLHRLSLPGGLAAFSITRPSAEQLFGTKVWRDPVDLDCVFYGTVSDGPISVLPIDPNEIAARMPASLAFERRSLTAAYQQYCFAFPGNRSSPLDDAPKLERRLLERAFAGKAAYELRHPYPVSLTDLFHAVAGVCA